MKYLSAALILVSACTCLSANAFVYRRVTAAESYHRNYEPVYGYDTPLNIVYFSGEVGLGHLMTPEEYISPPDNYLISGASYRTQSVAAGANLGFKHAVNRQFLIGGEVGYDFNGQSKYNEEYYPNFTWVESTNYTISSQDIHLLATGTILFHSGFNIFAKGGAARVEQKLKVSNDVDYATIPIYLGENTITQIKPMAAAGVGFQLRNAGIYAEYSHIFGKDAQNFEDFMDANGFTDVVSVDTFKVGLSIQTRI